MAPGPQGRPPPTPDQNKTPPVTGRICSWGGSVPAQGLGATTGFEPVNRRLADHNCPRRVFRTRSDEADGAAPITRSDVNPRPNSRPSSPGRPPRRPPRDLAPTKG